MSATQDGRGGREAQARPASIVEVFARNAERAPDGLCLSFEGEGET